MLRIVTGLTTGWRRLWRRPRFAIFAIATLAVALGLASSAYAVVISIVFPDTAFNAADELVNIYHTDVNATSSGSLLALSWPDFVDLKTRQKTMAEVFAWAPFRQIAVTNGVSQAVGGEMVSGGYFTTLAVPRSQLGRLIQPADDDPGAPPVVVISDLLWRRLFDARQGVVGEVLILNGNAFRIVGVSNRSFRGLNIPSLSPTAVWIPMGHAPLVKGRGFLYSSSDFNDRSRRWLYARGRVRPGRLASEVAAEVRMIGASLDREYPLGDTSAGQLLPSPLTSRVWQVLPSTSIRVHESLQRQAGVIATGALVAVCLVLLVGCTNLANLTLARNAVRESDLATRFAVGATRGHILRELLLESSLIAVLGLAFGIFLCACVLGWVRSTPFDLMAGLTLELSPRVDMRVTFMGIALAVMGLLVFGLVPAHRLSQTDPLRVLGNAGGLGSTMNWRRRQGLIAAQVLVAASLMSLAGICIQQVLHSSAHDSGIQMEDVALARVDFEASGRDEIQGRRSVESVLREVGLDPSVRSVAAASGLPYGVDTPGAFVTTVDRPFLQGRFRGHPAELLSGTDQLLPTLGVKVLRGRALDGRDTVDSLQVALLSEDLARTLFGGTEPIGRTVIVKRQRWAGEADQTPTERTVVGIVAATDTRTRGSRSHGSLYLPLSQHYESSLVFLVKAATGSASATAGRLRRSINRVDSGLAVLFAGTGVVLTGAGDFALKAAAGVATTLGIITLGYAMTGLYGIMSYVTAKRSREIGLRMALGARASQVIFQVISEGVRPVLHGTLAAVVLDIVVRYFLNRRLGLDLSILEPAFVLGAPVALCLGAFIACYFPAQRASRIDPNVALRRS